MENERIWSIDVKEFKGIKRLLHGPIKLAKFNVLVGRNSSGKTSLLEALALLPQPNQRLPFVEPPISMMTRADVVKSSHFGQTDSFVYGYSGVAELIYSVGGFGSTLFLQTDGKFHFEITNRNDVPKNRVVQSDSRADKPIVLDQAPISLSRIITSYYSAYLNDSWQETLCVEKNWKSVEKVRAHNKVLREVISPAIAETFTEVVPHYLEPARRWILQARKEFPDGTSSWIRLSELGEGLQRAIVPLLIFESTNASVILWDDLEAGMHPSLVESVLRYLSKRDWQIVLATHSIDVLAVLADLEPQSGCPSYSSQKVFR